MKITLNWAEQQAITPTPDANGAFDVPEETVERWEAVLDAYRAAWKEMHEVYCTQRADPMKTEEQLWEERMAAEAAETEALAAKFYSPT